MKRIPRLVTWLLMVLVVSVGCSGEFPLKWKPTEQQKQTADLVTRDLELLQTHVNETGTPVLAEATRGARTTQVYFGLPETRLTPVAPANEVVLTRAETDAVRPGPTLEEILDALEEEAGRKTDAAFSLAEKLLALLAMGAGTVGSIKGVSLVNGWRTKKNELKTEVAGQGKALMELVKGVAKLGPELKKEVKTIFGGDGNGNPGVLSPETEALVSKIKAGLKGN